MEGKPFKLKSGNKPAFKMMGAKTPAKHKVDGSYGGHDHKGMGLFERVTGKKFKDTKIGKGFYNEDGELRIKADLDQKQEDLKSLGTDVVKNQTPGTTKKEKETTPEVTYTNLKSEKGDPYEYRKGSDNTYQFRKGSEGEFTTAEGKGLDAIKERYDSPADMKSPVKMGHKSPAKMGHKSPSKMKKAPTKFNKGLKDAAASGKLDKNPKFKAAVEKAPAKMKKKMK